VYYIIVICNLDLGIEVTVCTCEILYVYVYVSGHSNYQIGQIGPNRCKSDQIGDNHYQIWKLCPQLHHCIRSTFSRYWIMRILNIRVQN